MILIGNIAFVTAAYLVEKGISLNTVKDALMRNRKGSSSAWQHIADPSDKRIKLIQYNTIPASLLERYGLPSHDSLLGQLKRQEHEATQQQGLDIAARVRHAHDHLAHRWLPHYEKIEVDGKVRYMDANTALLLARAAAMAVEGATIRQQRVYKSDFEAYVAALNALANPYLHGTYGSLRQKLNFHPENTAAVLAAIRPPRLGNSNRNSSAVFDRAHIGMIYAYDVCTLPVLHRRLAWLYMHDYSLPADRVPRLDVVKKVVADREFKNVWDGLRYGQERWHCLLLPRAKRIMAFAPSDCWMMDGTPAQLYYNNGKEARKLNLYVVFDVFTRRVLGYDLAQTEKWESVVRALAMAIHHAGHLPYQLIHDNASTMGTEQVEHLRSAMQRMGCTFTPAPVGQPQYKANMERFFGTLQSRWMSQMPNYVGEGITSRRASGRPNMDKLAKLLKGGRAGLPDLHQLRQQIAEIIWLYNNDEIEGRPSPLQLWQQHEAAKAIPLLPQYVAAALWPCHTIKVLRSQVCFTHEHTDYVYELSQGKERQDLRLRLNGKRINLYFCADSGDAYVFGTDGTYYCRAYPTDEVAGGLVTQQELGMSALHRFANDRRQLQAEIEERREEAATIVRREMDKANTSLERIADYRLLNKETLNELEWEQEQQYLHSANHISAPIARPVLLPIEEDTEDELQRLKAARAFTETRLNLLNDED